MPVEVRDARFVSVTAFAHGMRPRVAGLVVAGGGSVALALLPSWLGVLLIAAGVALFVGFYRKPAPVWPRVVVDAQGVWLAGMPAGFRLPFAAIACATCEMREVSQGNHRVEIPILAIDLQEPQVLAQVLPPGTPVKPAYELNCQGLDVGADDIVRCIDGYLDELGLKDRRLRQELLGKA